jgi:hypothetical protein
MVAEALADVPRNALVYQYGHPICATIRRFGLQAGRLSERAVPVDGHRDHGAVGGRTDQFFGFSRKKRGEIPPFPSLGDKAQIRVELISALWRVACFEIARQAGTIHRPGDGCVSANGFQRGFEANGTKVEILVSA